MSTSQRVSHGFHRLGLFLAGAFFLPGILVAAYFVLEAQDAAYREAVLPAAVKARVSVEAGLALGWKEFVGDAGRSVSLEHYGASADYKRLFQEFGITAEAVAAAAKDSLAGLQS